ncbi:MAG: hypothetical protein K8S87_00460 [Planctomycetes bacterium]|nr:hypothetical protein [Planctomycetota bacterium]
MKLVHLLLILCFILTSQVFAEELGAWESLQTTKDAIHFVEFIKKYPQSTYIQEAEILMFDRFPRLIVINIMIEDKALNAIIKLKLFEILKFKGYTPVICNSIKLSAPYIMSVFSESRMQDFSGTLPIMKIPNISIQFQKYDSEKAALEFSKAETLFSIPPCFYTDNYSEIDNLQNSIFRNAVNQLNTLEIEEAKDVKFNKVNIEKPDNDKIENTEDIIEPKLPTHKDDRELTIFDYEKRNYVEFELSAGININKLISDDGVSESSAEPTALDIHLITTAYIFSKLIIPKLYFNGFFHNKTVESWTLKSADLTCSIIDLGIFAELNFQELLSKPDGKGILNSNDTTIFAFAGIGILGANLILKRTNVKVFEYSQPDESTETFLAGLAWTATVKLRGFIDNRFFMQAHFINSILFTNKISGGYSLSIAAGFNITQNSAFSVVLTAAYMQYALNAEEYLYQDSLGVNCMYSITF